MEFRFVIGATILLLFGCETADKRSPQDELTVYHPEWPGIKIDPIEVDPNYRKIFSNIDAEVRTALKDHPQSFGFIHFFWTEKKEILMNKYGVDWRTPQEMNPHVNFD